jgi:cell division septal protein FtsQ
MSPMFCDNESREKRREEKRREEKRSEEKRREEKRREEKRREEKRREEKRREHSQVLQSACVRVYVCFLCWGFFLGISYRMGYFFYT